ncbi:glycosyltransferase family 4 protein [Flavobacterium daejeonense]|uniref:glycosyltransferase family 4 protein n=1 Tax=Flavobacterium daejeonense TaxID=350893 RepID=UPI00047CFF0D|nr:glycosyltransferase family 4 protein [Flavobacterium daejeonense]
MKILFVSMPSVHVIRWIENLKDTNHELYWFDVLDSGRLDTLERVHQFTTWRKRKFPYIKGEYRLQKIFPNMYEKVKSFLEVTANEALEQIILDIQPDVVHSFELHSCSYPILKTMQKFPKLKWLYSCWGNDLFYYRQYKTHLKRIQQVLARVNFLHTDCMRDFEIAKKLGFKGQFLGVIPGGTGYKIKELDVYKLDITERKIILVKGYEHKFGRGLNVIKALQLLDKELEKYKVIVFGAHQKVIDYITSNRLDFTFFDRHGLSHKELMQLMGKSLVYIGNSISDGMPNTMLEAVVMGAFPIQSNPGGASEEIIVQGRNGYLIANPESVSEIKEILLKALSEKSNFVKAAEINQQLAQERLDYAVNQLRVIEMYNTILKCG